MNKLFGLFLLAVAFLAPVGAEAANCFWVGGTGTWDGTNTGGGGAGGIKWASGTGGASPCAGGGTGGSPAAADNATFDAASGGGTVTVNTTVALTNLTAGAFTGTLDFATNNNNVTASGDVVFSGSGTRTINMGSGTWTLGGTGANTFLIGPTITGLTITTTNAVLVLNGNSANRAVNFGTSNTFASLTISNNSTRGWIGLNCTTACTFGSVTIGTGNAVGFSQGVTTTITGALTMTGTSAAPVLLTSTASGTNVATVSVGSASTLDWGGILRVTRSGAGTLNGTNCLDFGGNTSITSCAAPAGGGGGGRIIGA